MYKQMDGQDKDRPAFFGFVFFNMRIGPTPLRMHASLSVQVLL